MTWNVRILLCAMGFLTLFFSNCSSPFQNYEGDDSSLVAFSAFSQGTYADLNWSAESKSIKVNENSQVERLLDQTMDGISLYPPYRIGTASLNLDAAPRLGAVDNRKWLNFLPQTTLTSVASDLSEFVSDNYTVALVVQGVTPGANLVDDPKVVRLFGLVPTNGDETGYLGIDVAPTAAGGLQFYVFIYFNATNVKSYTYVLENQSVITGTMALVARYNKAGDKLTLLINGAKVTADIATQGSPPQLPLAPRKLFIHIETGYGSYGRFKLGELAMWRRALSDDELLYYSKNLFNYWTGRPIEGAPTGGGNGTGGTDVFPQIAAIFEATKNTSGSNCLACHASITSKSWILAEPGWIKKGDPPNSLLIQAVTHVLGGTKDMPSGGGQMAASDIQKIRDWIQAGAN